MEKKDLLEPILATAHTHLRAEGADVEAAIVRDYPAQADPSVPDDEQEYSEEFARMILAADARGCFEELDCDEHLAYLDNLIDQARAAEVADNRDQDNE